jgi:hypothetical protein
MARASLWNDVLFKKARKTNLVAREKAKHSQKVYIT